MSIDASLAKKSYPDRIETNNKIELESGDYEAHIHDVWIYYVDIDGKYTKNRDDASGQKIKFTVTLDGTKPAIALAMELPIKISKNSYYSKTIESLTGIADRDKHLTFDPKTLVGKEVIAKIKYEEKVRRDNHDPYPWSKIEEMRPRQTLIKKPAPVRATSPAPVAQDDDFVPFPDDSDYERR